NDGVRVASIPCDKRASCRRYAVDPRADNSNWKIEIKAYREKPDARANPAIRRFTFLYGFSSAISNMCDDGDVVRRDRAHPWRVPAGSRRVRVDVKQLVTAHQEHTGGWCDE